MKRMSGESGHMAIRRWLQSLGIGLLAFSCYACAGTASPQYAASPVEIEPIVKSSSADSLARADAARDAGAYGEAIAGYRTVLSAEPGEPAALFGLAESLRKSGDPDSAVPTYLKIVSDEAWRLKSLEGLGFAHIALGDPASARETFDIALNENPAAWRASLGKAQLADLDRDWLGADAAYEQALDASDNPSLVLNNYGVSKLSRNEPRAAENLFQRALEINPASERTRINLEIAQAVINPTIDQLGTKADPRKRAQRLNNRGYVAMLQRRFTEAETLFRQAIEAHPAFYPAAYENLQMLKALAARGVES